MTLPNRTLAVIVDELHTALNSETATILTMGTLLTEAKAHVKHGEWLPWLKDEFSMSQRSAQKYMKAAEFALKNELGADLKLSPSALYLLSEDRYWDDRDSRLEATEAVIKAAREERVGYERAKEIIDATSCRSTPVPNTATESEAIPTVTEPTGALGGREGEIETKDDALVGFSSVVRELVRIITKQKVERFAATSVVGDELAAAGKFLTDLADLKKTRGAERPVVGNGIESPEESAAKRKRENEDAEINDLAA